MIEDERPDPDWETPLLLQVAPAALINTLMASATAVHTGWSSCVQDELVVGELNAVDDNGNHVRLIEQEFVEDEDPDSVWHDWTLEVRIGEVLITGHWQVRNGGALIDWEWHANEAEKAFEFACVLIGRRVRRGLSVEEPAPVEAPVKAVRH